MTAEVQLEYELLRTWEEHYQLLLEIVNYLSPDAPQLRSDLQVTDWSTLHKVVVSKSATTPHTALVNTEPELIFPASMIAGPLRKR